MRIALVSTIAIDEDGESLALASFAGRTLLDWQISLATQLGCEKVICLIERLEEGLLPVQHRVERAGLTFHTVRGPHQMLGLVTADDDIVAIADGLVVERDLASEVLGQGRGVAVVDIDAGLAAGLQRIDAEWAWAGLMIVRGHLVEQLANLPADSDTLGSLLRLALQAGSAKREIDDEHLADGTFVLANGSNSLIEQEKRFFHNELEAAPPTAPGLFFAGKVAHYLAARPKPVASGVIVGIAVLYLIGAGVLAWYDLPAIALATFALAVFAAAVAIMLDGFSARVWGEAVDDRVAFGFNAFLDVVLIALLAKPWDNLVWSVPMFGAIVLVLAIRLAALIDRASWRWTWQDRMSLALLLASAALVDELEVAVVAIGIAMLLYTLFRARNSELTRT